MEALGVHLGEKDSSLNAPSTVDRLRLGLALRKLFGLRHHAQ